MTYEALAAALTATGIPFREGAWRNAEEMRTDYGAYALDGRDDLNADDHHAEKMLEGTVDLFTADAGRIQKAKVEAALEASGVFWRVGLAGSYEDDTGLTHWEWIFNCLE